VPFAQKPPSCSGCPLATLGSGFVPPSGPPDSPVLFVGEAPGQVEALTGVPFAGLTGGKFGHLLYRLSRAREDQRVHNTISCRPPNDWLEGAPWEAEAVAHCRPNLDRVLAESHQVIVTLGASATRRVLGLGARPDMRNFHGTVSELSPQRWVVPTFHPAHLIRGAHNLTGTVLYDLARAFEVAKHGWVEDRPRLVIDPPAGWFAEWVAGYLAALAEDPERLWMAVDVETPDKEGKLDEGELRASDRSMEIIRYNFSFDPDEGITVPATGPYEAHVQEILESVGAKCFWNKHYDLRRLRPKFRLRGPLLDFMDAWHALHSDVPKGLGYVAPYYSRWGPWKHLSASNPGLYAAGDGVQTLRCAYGIARDLSSQGMWNVFWRHMHEVGDEATSPSCEVGLKIDREQLEGKELPDGTHQSGMRDRLREKSAEFYTQMQELVPEALRPLHPKDGWVRCPAGADGQPLTTYLYPPEGEDHSRLREVLEIPRELAVRVCATCGATQVPARHRCKGENGKPTKDLQAKVENRVTSVSRFYVREDWNPGSWQQVLAYIKHCGHKPGREKGKETTNRETIERLADSKPRNRKDEQAREVYRLLLDYRDVKKVLGTYVEGMLKRLDESPDDRVHPVVNNNPSTLRTAYNSPNLQNVVADRRGGESLSAGFRSVVVAEPGCKLIEVDWSGVEAVNTGWCAGAPEFIKLAWLGIHDFLCSHAVHAPADLSWPLDDLLGYFREIKANHKVVRDQCKSIVHGTDYDESAEGVYRRFRKLFPSLQAAQQLQELYHSIVPQLQPWQRATQELAFRQEYLGGAGTHPFAYRHEFYNVYDFRLISDSEAIRARRLRLPVTQLNGRWYRILPGEDAKRCIAFFPQSIAAGMIRETALRLFKPEEPEGSWIGASGPFGKTPLRAIIHDSFLLEVPEARVEQVIEAVARQMTRPFPQLHVPAAWGLGEGGLRFGVEVKVGRDWAAMEKVAVPQPWLAILKGSAAATEQLDLADRDPVDEVEDDEEETAADYRAAAAF
jgi:uracil-DNA glycosylase family 4